MRTHFLGLATLCALFLVPPAWSSDTPPLASPGPVQIRMTGALWFAKHLRFGQPAMAVSANGQTYWLDYRNAEGMDRISDWMPTDIRHAVRVEGRLDLLAGPDGKKEPTVVLSRIDRASPTAADAVELEVTGTIRYYRHIDRVTGQGAAAVVAGEQEFALDLRQLKGGVPDFGGPLVVKGRMSREGRLVVTDIRPAMRPC